MAVQPQGGHEPNSSQQQQDHWLAEQAGLNTRHTHWISKADASLQ